MATDAATEEPTSTTETSSPTLAPTREGDTVENSSKAEEAKEKTPKKRWALPSLPILSILQGVFLVLMIGQSLPGAEHSFWPFNKKSSGATDPSTSQRLSPFFVEMRKDMYGHQRQFPAQNDDTGGFLGFLFGPKPEEPTIPLNTGIPAKQEIVLTHLNRQYESYRYSVRSVTDSKVVAGHEFAQVSFRRALEKVLARLKDPDDQQRLIDLEEKFLDKASQLLDKHARLRASLPLDSEQQGLQQELSTGLLQKCHDTDVFQPSQCPLDDSESIMNTNTTNAATTIGTNTTRVSLEMTTVESELGKTIATFLNKIDEILPRGVASAIRDALKCHLSAGYGTHPFVRDLLQTPMRSLLLPRRQRLFVTYFTGDLFASDVSILRKEVTAILQSAEPETDEVLVVLQSGGGTVTGYGLVAAQLLRIKNAGLRLTVAVEQVAASGGYLAACVGHRIVCSPFAVVGSIGVVQEMPNAYERLKREGIEFHSITAGEYKRVLSPTKEVTPEDLQKAKDELEEIHTLFKDFVHEHRPDLDMEVVGTGEVWFGTKAVERGLCDAIQSADDVLSDFVNRGYDVYQVKYEEPLPDFLQQFLDRVSMRGTDSSSMIWEFLQQMVRMPAHLGDIATWLVGDNRRNRILMDNHRNRVLMV